MVHQRENDVWSSVSFAYKLLKKYGVNFTASLIIAFKLTIFYYYFMFLNRQMHLKKVANCVKYKLKLKQSNFERYAKKILDFEHSLSQIPDIKLPLTSWS
jgi:hypothetical protein